MSYYNEFCLRVHEKADIDQINQIQKKLIEERMIDINFMPVIKESYIFSSNLRYWEWYGNYKSYDHLQNSELHNYLNDNFNEGEFGLLKIGESIEDLEEFGNPYDFGISFLWEIKRD